MEYYKTYYVKLGYMNDKTIDSVTWDMDVMEIEDVQRIRDCGTYDGFSALGLF